MDLTETDMQASAAIESGVIRVLGRRSAAVIALVLGRLCARCGLPVDQAQALTRISYDASLS